jgi:orotate phosphoribosyltransferase
VLETIEIVRSRGGEVVAVGSIVDRSGRDKPNFGCKFESLLQLQVETFAPDQLPPDLRDVPAIKPGSR